MSENNNNTGKRGLLKNSSGVAFSNLLSRMLGLLRVRLEATVLGGGELASAWLLAFAIPNLLRRVLGEGAISNALTPLLADTEVQHGAEKVRKRLAVTFAVLGMLLALIVVVVSLGSWLIVKYGGDWGIAFSPHVKMMFQLLPLLMPYGFFITLVGVAGTVLNYAKIFLRPALAALLLNIVLLGGLSAAWILAMPPGHFMPMLAILVPLSGVLQFVMILLWLRSSGYFPDFRNFWQEIGFVKTLFKLAVPGILGYLALQISFLIDQGMAASLGGQAIPALNYVNRIIDIPIGLVAVSLGTVLTPMMSKSAANGRCDEIGDTLSYCMRLIWFVTIPMAVLVIFFHNNVLQILCLGGRYTVSDLNAAHQTAIFYGFGIPFFCSLKVILPAFYARKKMYTVLAVSLIAITANVIFNYILMRYWAQGGIALATVISSLINNTLLLLLLKRENMISRAGMTTLTFVRSTVVSLAIGGGLYWLYLCRFKDWCVTHWSYELIFLAGAGGVFLILYFAASLLLRSPECREVVGFLRRLKR